MSANLPVSIHGKAVRPMNDEKTIVETISTAWNAYQETEKYGLDFGKACYECQLRVATRGGVGNKGRGIVPTLEQLKIPKSTAYYWIKRYKWHAGLEAPPPEPEDRALDGSEYADLATISEILTSAEPAVSSDRADIVISRYDGGPVAMTIAEITASLVRCSICGGTGASPYDPCTCTACGLSVCRHCWPLHQAGHQTNLDLYRLPPQTPPTPGELIRRAVAELRTTIALWPCGESLEPLVKAVEAVFVEAIHPRATHERELVGGGR